MTRCGFRWLAGLALLGAAWGARAEDPSGLPQLRILGFGDFGYKYQETSDGRDSNDFSIGELDLFTTSELGEKLSVLGEVVFDLKDQEHAVTVHRLQLQYSFSDLLNVWVGRMHVPMGYWNAVYHHGGWFQTTASRPAVHSANILPQHFVGVQALGVKSLSIGELEYNLGVANGRGRDRADISAKDDPDNGKAVQLRVQVKPRAWPRLYAGVSGYADTIPAAEERAAEEPHTHADEVIVADLGHDEGLLAARGKMKERIAGVHVGYNGPRLEMLAEAFRIRHSPDEGGEELDTEGGYLLAAYQVGLFKPYYRLDVLNFAEEDAYYEDIAHDFTGHSLGVRWDPFTWNALKLEFTLQDRDHSPDVKSLFLQSAVTF